MKTLQQLTCDNYHHGEKGSELVFSTNKVKPHATVCCFDLTDLVIGGSGDFRHSGILVNLVKPLTKPFFY